MPQYSRAQLLEAARTDHSEFRKVDDNKLFAAIAQDHPDLAKGISELNQPAFQSTRYTGTGAPAGKLSDVLFAPQRLAVSEPSVMSDAAENVLKGVPEAITGIPAALGAVGGALWRSIRGDKNAVPKLAGEITEGMVAPFKQVAQGAAEVVAPGSQGPQVAPESPEWAQAARAGGTMLAGAELPNALAGAGRAISPVLQRMRGMVPSKAAAGQKFGQVAAKANDVPLQNLVSADDIALEAKQLGDSGATLPKVMNRYFAERQKSPTMTYEQGRRFAKNAGRVSATEAMASNPEMKMLTGKFYDAMKTANREAAASVGMGEVYDAAINEFRKAAKLADAAEIAAKWTKRAVIAGTAGAAGVKIFNEFSR